MKFYPKPGIIIIAPEKTENVAVITDEKAQKKIKAGKVIAVGLDGQTNSGAVLKMKDYAKVGEAIFFLTYDEGYDLIEIGKDKYHAVKIEDVRTGYGK